MYICPVCNGFFDLHVVCPSCGKMMEDKGRWMDYFDDYSAYMPIDLMKLEDGFKQDYQDHLCPHLAYCSSCDREEISFIKE